MKYQHVVGLDHGNGWLKARGEKKLIIPSLIAKEENVGETMGGKQKLGISSFESSHKKGVTFVAGEDISSVDGYIPTYGQSNRYEQEPFILLSQFAISEALGKEKSYEDVLVVTGVPSDEFGTTEQDKLMKALKGTFVINNKAIQVVDVIVIPQPLGTLMSRYLDEEGFVEKESYEEWNIGVIDIGTGTTDLDAIKALRRQNNHKSIPYGMHDVYSSITKKLKKGNPSSGISEQGVEHYFNDESYVVSAKKQIPFKNEKEIAIEDIGTQLIAGIRGEWKQHESFDEILITGGGAGTFTNSMKDYFKGTEVDLVENPQFANVEGFYRHGVLLKGIEDNE